MLARARTSAFAAAVLLVTASAGAQESGPVISTLGPVWDVEAPDFVTPLDLDYKVAFEMVTPVESPDRANGALINAARFLNMHARAGILADQVQVVVVVHGGAAWELLDAAAFAERNDGAENPNAELLRELVAAGARVIFCGQTVGARGIPREQLLPEVEVVLSAMTAMYVLQEEGFRVNLW
ncbi:MAG: hypothetical protein GKS06_17230 [Acidobacteria bacterium]|nr:hypothetical protein [Acidobacteriota bacterium]